MKVPYRDLSVTNPKQKQELLTQYSAGSMFHVGLGINNSSIMGDPLHSSVLVDDSGEEFTLNGTKTGIVFAEEAGVRSEPNLRGEPAFLLHEGTKAKLLENYQEWYKIEIADGKQGWMLKENLKEL